MTAPATTLHPACATNAEMWLALERAADVRSCGGKAASLGRMLRAGLPVPPAVVLTTHALQAFLAQTALLQHVEALESQAQGADSRRLARIEHEIRQAFEATPAPPAFRQWMHAMVAALPAGRVLVVRSSAVGEDDAHASCAGLMDSILNVQGVEALERAVRQVWASRWSARALAYSEMRRVPLGRMAIIVQVQVDPAYAGVLFTRSPEPTRRQEMLCEYCEGLADKLVNGAVVPGRMSIDRASLQVRRIAQPAHHTREIDDDAIHTLATAALAAERMFGSPQDIEWALADAGRLWLVQSRPITTTPQSSNRRRIVWSNANVSENFPEPITPLLYSIVVPGYSHYFANLGRAFGLPRWRQECMADDLRAIVGVHAGRLYYNLSAIHAVLRGVPLGDRLVAWFDDFTGAADPSSVDRSPQPSTRRSLRDALELGWMAAKTAWQYVFIEQRVRRFESRIDAFAQRSQPSRLERLSVLELRDLLRQFVDIRLRGWTEASLADAAAMVCYGMLKSLVARVNAQTHVDVSHNALLQGLSGLESAEPVQALWTLAERVRSDAALAALFANESGSDIAARLADDARFAEFHRAYLDYLERWGFRCSGELLLTVPSFQEVPEQLIDIIRSYAANSDGAPKDRLALQRQSREEATRVLLSAAGGQRIAPWLPGVDCAQVAKPLLRATQASIAYRERARLKQALLYSRLRRIALAIGDRLARSGKLHASEDIFYLTVPEIDELVSGHAMFPETAPALVALRRSVHARFADREPPDVLMAPEGAYPDTAPAPDAGFQVDGNLQGASVCGGVATGTARVLTHVAETPSLRRGDILIARQTDPGWAPAFAMIRGLVLERGGMLSHGAILAREYGIPTLVGVPAATRRIQSGSLVRVDADRGEVHVQAR